MIRGRLRVMCIGCSFTFCSIAGEAVAVGEIEREALILVWGEMEMDRCGGDVGFLSFSKSWLIRRRFRDREEDEQRREGKGSRKCRFAHGGISFSRSNPATILQGGTTGFDQGCIRSVSL